MTKDTIYLIRTTNQMGNDQELSRVSVKFSGEADTTEVLEQVYYFMLSMGYSSGAIGRTFQELGDIYGPRDDD